MICLVCNGAGMVDTVIRVPSRVYGEPRTLLRLRPGALNAAVAAESLSALMASLKPPASRGIAFVPDRATIDDMEGFQGV